MTPRCSHRATYYYMDPCTEAGWKCQDCGKTLGFRPDLDREMTEIKTNGILHDMHEAQVIYISNGTMGEIIAGNVAARCKELGLFDQLTIARLILEDVNVDVPGHAEFWKARAIKYMNERNRHGIRSVRRRTRCQEQDDFLG